MVDAENQLPDPSSEGLAPKAVVSRLSLYLRELQHLIRDGHETTSSTQLGSRLGVTDAQIRKDLAYFGQFGYPGIGYRCEELVGQIRKILGTDHDWPVAIVGLGNLGTALLGHRGFSQKGFRVVAGFDIDPNKIGTQIHSVPVYHLLRLPETVQSEAIRLAILAVPAGVAQEVADQLVAAGIHGIMNFTPVTISLPTNVSIVAVDLAIELEQLSFAVVNSRQNA
jgi:redox-sensing transcriptional repressor